MGKQIDENKKVIERCYNIMTGQGDYKDLKESEKTEEMFRFLLVDMSRNLAIIADKLTEGK